MESLPVNDIPITIFNCTGKNDFMIVIFTKNADVNAIETPFVAWHTIKVGCEGPYGAYMQQNATSRRQCRAVYKQQQ